MAQTILANVFCCMLYSTSSWSSLCVRRRHLKLSTQRIVFDDDDDDDDDGDDVVVVVVVVSVDRATDIHNGSAIFVPNTDTLTN